MKIAVLLKMARQVEGEYHFISIMKASVNPDQLYRYMRETTLPRTETINDIQCVVEYGIYENIEVEGLDPKMEENV